MRSTLFHIPGELFGQPVFGIGLLLAVCIIGSLLLLAFLFRRHGFNNETGSYVLLLAAICGVVAFLLPRICEPEGLPIRGYGVMLLVAVLSAVGLAVWRGKRRGLDSEQVVNLSFWAFVPGIVGARIFYIIEYWPDFQRETLSATLGAMASLDQGGLVVYGSFIGASIGLLTFVIKNKMRLLSTLDLLAPSMVLGASIGRLGCFLNGCCFGGECDLPWAVTFPPGSPAHIHQVCHGQTSLHGLTLRAGPNGSAIIADVKEGSPAQLAGVKVDQEIEAVNGQRIASVDGAYQWMMLVAEDAPQIEILVKHDPGIYRWAISPPTSPHPIHPTQLYSAVNALLICLFLLALSPYCRRDGQVWAALLTIYPVTRFLLEIIRKDESAIFGTGMSISQNVSLALLVVAAGLWCYTVYAPPKKAVQA